MISFELSMLLQLVRMIVQPETLLRLPLCVPKTSSVLIW
jgi:hypothetical protein